MSTELLLNGVAFDLAPDTALLPSFQVSDLLKPESIQSDYSPEVSVPGTARNHALLGAAAVDGNAARVPYKSLTGASLRTQGVELMPRARLFIKGYSEGRYQLQLFAGNRRFVEALGEKTLRDLDFSRFNHSWTFDSIAERATAAYREANGWHYELYERGRPLELGGVSPFELYPTLSAGLIWQQLLAEAGFEASVWGSELLDRLQLPAVRTAQLSQGVREARRLLVTTGNGFQDSGRVDTNRRDVVRTIPFNNFSGSLGTIPLIVPTVPGVYNPGSFAYIADQPMYVSVTARTALRILYSEIRLGRAQAVVELHVNGLPVKLGEEVVAQNEDAFSVGVVADKLLLQQGDVLTAVLRLSGVGSGALGDKWGFEIFQFTIYRVKGVSIPEDKFEVNVLEEMAPGGKVSLSDFLPDISQLDFFKMLTQLGGLSVTTDPYEDFITLATPAEKLGAAQNAKDWTSIRDEPPGPRGMPRKVEFKWGQFGQKNYFKWAEDESVSAGYGDGFFVVDDKTLPEAYTMLTLPFAATEKSKVNPGLLQIRNFRLRESEDAFADPVYERVEAKPRLTLASEKTIEITIVEGQQRRTISSPTSYFASEELGTPSLDAQAYILPTNWKGLQSVLADCRVLTERYRLTASDIAEFVKNPHSLIWDANLGGYFWVKLISEFSASRSTEVTMMRIHPAYLNVEPVVSTAGEEFSASEWYGNEFY